MLASGRPVVATAASGTGLANEVEGCGLITHPGDTEAFAKAIEIAIDDDVFSTGAGTQARGQAIARWSRTAILSSFNSNLQMLIDQ